MESASEECPYLSPYKCLKANSIEGLVGRTQVDIQLLLAAVVLLAILYAFVKGVITGNWTTTYWQYVLFPAAIAGSQLMAVAAICGIGFWYTFFVIVHLGFLTAVRFTVVHGGSNLLSSTLVQFAAFAVYTLWVAVLDRKRSPVSLWCLIPHVSLVALGCVLEALHQITDVPERSPIAMSSVYGTVRERQTLQGQGNRENFDPNFHAQFDDVKPILERAARLNSYAARPFLASAAAVGLNAAFTGILVYRGVHEYQHPTAQSLCIQGAWWTLYKSRFFILAAFLNAITLYYPIRVHGVGWKFIEWDYFYKAPGREIGHEIWYCFKESRNNSERIAKTLLYLRRGGIESFMLIDLHGLLTHIIQFFLFAHLLLSLGGCIIKGVIFLLTTIVFWPCGLMSRDSSAENGNNGIVNLANGDNGNGNAANGDNGIGNAGIGAAVIGEVVASRNGWNEGYNCFHQGHQMLRHIVGCSTREFNGSGYTSFVKSLVKGSTLRRSDRLSLLGALDEGIATPIPIPEGIVPQYTEAEASCYKKGYIEGLLVRLLEDESDAQATATLSSCSCFRFFVYKYSRVWTNPNPIPIPNPNLNPNPNPNPGALELVQV